jgi:hypothetical protein
VIKRTSDKQSIKQTNRKIQGVAAPRQQVNDQTHWGQKPLPDSSKQGNNIQGNAYGTRASS